MCLNEKEVENFVKEIIRVTKKGGTILISGINDCNKRETAMQIRPETQKQLFLCKSTIEKLADDLQVSSIIFLDEESAPFAEFYPNAKYKFSVYIKK